MANNQNQKNRDDQTTNNQTNDAQRTQNQNDPRTMQQDGKDQRAPTGNLDQGNERQEAPGRKHDGSSNR